MDRDYARIAREFMRELRGGRSQNAFSRRLGYRTNVAYAWESGRAFPTAASALLAAARSGIDVPAALTRFYRRQPAWLDRAEATSPAGVAALLDDLRGRSSIVDLARSCDRNRFAVARWLRGQAEPRLPDFFLLIDRSSTRLLDWLSSFVNPSRLPSIGRAWSALEEARRSAYDAPWTQAVLRCLELGEYRALPRHVRGWIAAKVGISEAEEQQCLRLLHRTGQIFLRRGRWEIRQVMAIDTRRDAAAELRVKRWWTEVALGRLSNPDCGIFSYNVFAVSASDLARINQLYRSYFAEMRAIIAKSEPSERVVLSCLQMVPLDADTGAEPSQLR